jgi:5-methylcytosine-specific restriction endonuclease McrA
MSTEEMRAASRERAAKWRAAHPAEVKAQNALYRQRNPEKIKRVDAEYRLTHRDQINANALKRYYADPQKTMAANARRRVRLRDGKTERFTSVEIFERDHWVCGICHKPINRRRKSPDRLSASIDHIRPVQEGGFHTRANVQAAHRGCNAAKGARLPA